MSGWNSLLDRIGKTNRSAFPVEGNLRIGGNNVDDLNPVPITLVGDQISGDQISSYVAYPMEPLRPVYKRMTGREIYTPRAVGVDGYIYASMGGTAAANLRIARSEDAFDTLDLGYDFSTEIPDGAIGYVTKTHAGYVVVARYGGVGSRGVIFFSEDFDKNFVKVQDLTDGVGVGFGMGIHFYNGMGLEQIGLVGEYTSLAPGKVHRLWLSKDGGQTWEIVLGTNVVGSGSNSHWHSVTYDPYEGRIYASQGDNVNGRFWYSDDLGQTWSYVTDIIDKDGIGGIQNPTLMIPTPDKLIITPDLTSPPMIMSLTKDSSFKEVGKEKWILNHEYSVWAGTPSAYHFATMPYSHRGNEIYLVYPANTLHDVAPVFHVIGSGDNGRSWHKLYGTRLIGDGRNRMNHGIVGPDNNGNLLAYLVTDESYLWIAKTIEWDGPQVKVVESKESAARTVTATSLSNTSAVATMVAKSGKKHYVTGYFVVLRGASAADDVSVQIKNGETVIVQDYIGKDSSSGERIGIMFTSPIQGDENTDMVLSVAAAGEDAITELTLMGYTL